MLAGWILCCDGGVDMLVVASSESVKTTGILLDDKVCTPRT